MPSGEDGNHPICSCDCENHVKPPHFKKIVRAHFSWSSSRSNTKKAMLNRSKIIPLSGMAERAAAARADGGIVVLAHGVFDVLHLGHVRHLEEAKARGDVLLVTVTPDRFVNKGPDRPIFSAEMRAEMLASLEIVDFVAVSDSPTAVSLIETLRPNIYVKGKEYADAEADVTGGISREQSAVEACGGSVYFTDDITFSSSNLINRSFNPYDAELRAYLDTIRTPDQAAEISALLDKVADYRVVLVGDTIIDEYCYVETLGKSPKENMIATRHRDREVFAGGVIAAANHVAGFCRHVEVITTLGADDPYTGLVRAALKPNVTLHAVSLADRPTVCKRRYVETGYLRKLFEVYTIDERPICGAEEQGVEDLIAERAKEADLVIATDFGHGMITRRLIGALIDNARFLAVNTQSNSANLGYNLITRYPRADYICIDAPEARLAMSDKFTDLDTLIGQDLSVRTGCNRLVVTEGKKGCTTYDRAVGAAHIPSFTRTVVDTVGAGDAFLSVTAPLAAAGGRMELVGLIGNAAGAMKVGIVGHRSSIEKAPLVKYLTALLK